MDDQHLFDELLQAAEKLGVEVRMEPFQTPATKGGGLCILRGEKLVLIDQSAPLTDRIFASLGRCPNSGARQSTWHRRPGSSSRQSGATGSPISNELVGIGEYPWISKFQALRTRDVGS
jgi:hypothetical protein